MVSIFIDEPFNAHEATFLVQKYEMKNLIPLITTIEFGMSSSFEAISVEKQNILN